MGDVIYLKSWAQGSDAAGGSKAPLEWLPYTVYVPVQRTLSGPGAPPPTPLTRSLAQRRTQEIRARSRAAARQGTNKRRWSKTKLKRKHVPRLGEQSLRRPPLRGQRLSVRHREVLIRWRLTASLVRGLSFSCTAGRCPSPVRKAGRWRGSGTRSAAATLDACRALLADHLSYGDRWGNPPAGA
ncbi:unnamed protein product [Pleuronectes platessa]|uniref:Uncharacterized protein n=1 Tax=Pleuronectes platessa TaxID=8262 RepID=A0A9N7V6Y7_PLEPL|nr:unnamed protein product [Pleuronectes platessa]